MTIQRRIKKRKGSSITTINQKVESTSKKVITKSRKARLDQKGKKVTGITQKDQNLKKGKIAKKVRKFQKTGYKTHPKSYEEPSKRKRNLLLTIQSIPYRKT